mmetsp:Transcript_5423/g.17111  ORF Transcript_5423/g.17111 Transcript_5423/m.17111 type:complete len:219 (+) Transcript_5423:1006-1662(+)
MLPAGARHHRCGALAVLGRGARATLEDPRRSCRDRNAADPVVGARCAVPRGDGDEAERRRDLRHEPDDALRRVRAVPVLHGGLLLLGRLPPPRLRHLRRRAPRVGRRVALLRQHVPDPRAAAALLQLFVHLGPDQDAHARHVLAAVRQHGRRRLPRRVVQPVHARVHPHPGGAHRAQGDPPPDAGHRDRGLRDGRGERHPAPAGAGGGPPARRARDEQ